MILERKRERLSMVNEPDDGAPVPEAFLPKGARRVLPIVSDPEQRSYAWTGLLSGVGMHGAKVQLYMEALHRAEVIIGVSV